MIKINVICIGKIKEAFFRDAISEYSKRLSRYCNLNIIELPDKSLPDKINSSIEQQIKDFESEEIISHIPKESYVICLDLTGKSISSEDFANKISNLQLTNSSITFIIGGSYGIHDRIKQKAHYHLSFSKMTFPHQLFRIILLVQLYRSYKIKNNETYHK